MNKEIKLCNLMLKSFILNYNQVCFKHTKLTSSVLFRSSKIIKYDSFYKFLTKSSDTSTSNQTSQSANESSKKIETNEVHYSNVKLRVVPKNVTNKTNTIKIDYSKRYTANNFITIVRAFNEFLLKPGDLEGLTQYKRRNPFDEYGQEELISVYLRSDVEAKALQVWGSIENIAKEKERRKLEYDEKREVAFRLKKSLRDYQKRIDSLENPFNDNQYSNTTIYKTLSGKVVLSAVAINASNFLVKLFGWLYSGSHSLFAEAIHSLADTINQLILAFGLHQSLKQPNKDHPYGYSNMTYITSLISGVGIFCFGTGLSFYHGIMGLYDPHPVESLNWALFLLLGSAFSESGTLALACMDIKQNAKKLGLNFWDYVLQGHRPSVNVVLLEDIAAVLGVFIAGTCMTITHYTGNPVADCIGSLLVGCVMGGVASFIIYSNSIALVGKSIPAKKINLINNDLESDIMVRSIHDVKATNMGQTVMFKAEVDIDGREITRSYLEKIDIEKLLIEISQIDNVEQLEAFMLNHGENIVDRVGAEIDRIERNLRKKYPEIQHVDLEVL